MGNIRHLYPAFVWLGLGLAMAWSYSRSENAVDDLLHQAVIQEMETGAAFYPTNSGGNDDVSNPIR